MEDHHIIPRAWYKRQGINVDNSDENIVSLPGKDHFKAHYLMFKYLESTDDLDMTFRMLFPVISMMSPFWRNDAENLSDLELEQCGMLYQEAREKFCQMQHDAIWATDGTTNKRFQRNEPVPDGWIPNKRVQHYKVKRIWITDGNQNKLLPVSKQIPHGFRIGKCFSTFNPGTDVWITDGAATVK